MTRLPVSPDDIDDIAAAVADIYREGELAVLRQVGRHLKQYPGAPTATVGAPRLEALGALRRSVSAIQAGLQADGSRAIREGLAAAWRLGTRAALVDIPAAWWPRSGLSRAAEEARRLVPQQGAIEALATAIVRDVGNVVANILRDSLDAYRSAIAGGTARMLAGGQTRREATQAAWQQLVDRGITGFTDRANRRWRLSSYAEMAMRTASARAAVQGQDDRLESLGLDLVYISDHVQECGLCRPWEGRILHRVSGPTGPLRVEHATQDDVWVMVDVAGTVAGARAAGLWHPNCFPGDVLTSAPTGVRAADSRWYEGQLVVIHTARGEELPVTPNHPVLTPEGWVPAGQLEVGSRVLRYRSDVQGVDVVGPHDHQVPARIGDVFDALRESGEVSAVRVPASPEQFHGDGGGSDVEVVLTHSLLENRGDAASVERGREGAFVVGGMGEGALLPEGAPFKVSEGAGHAAHRAVGSADLGGSLVCRHGLPLQPFGIATRATDAAPAELVADLGLGYADLFGDLGLREAALVEADRFVDPRSTSLLGDSGGSEPPVDGVSADADGGRDLARGLSGLVTADDVVEVEVRDFAGHVYNLQTGGGWYVANGLVVSNCRHSMSAYIPGVTRVPQGRPDPAGYDARMRQREIERHIRRWKERAAAATTDEARRAANAKVRSWQAAMRQHLDDHPGLKRLRYREAPGAGSTPPRGQRDPATPIGPAVQQGLTPGDDAQVRATPRRR